MVAGCGLLLANPGRSAGLETTNSPAGLLQKPDWLTEVSLAVKESYDDNVFMLANVQPGMPLESSWITTISPKVGFDFAPLLGQPSPIEKLSLVYAPDFGIYPNLSSETYGAQRITNAIAGKFGAASFTVDNGLAFIDGSDQGPTFRLPSGKKEDYNVFAVTAARERRLQVQDGARVVLQYDAEKFFVRPTASLLFYDLMTAWHNNGSGTGPATPGYINYVDRTDVNGGLDAGYKITPNLVATLGYRYGHQYQQSFPYNINTLQVNGQQAQSSSDYQRVLIGLEGRACEWLTLKLSGGPDFRAYNIAAPVDDRYPINYYDEAVVTAAIASNQSLSFGCKHWQWVSSIGRLPYAETCYMMAYHWNPLPKLGLDLSTKYADQDYTCGSAVLTKGASLRNDAMFTMAGGIGYALNPNLSASLTYSYDLGRNLQDSVATSEYRDFDHQVVSLGVKFGF